MWSQDRFLQFFYIFLIFNCIKMGLARQKVWIPNTNFNNPLNWNEGRIPCHSDRVIFPSDTELSVFIQEDITVKEIFLPNNGEMILPSRGQINIGIIANQPCSGKDMRFIGTEVRHWYDPANWKVLDTWGNLNSDPSTDPVPHAEKIPCTFDDAVFPTNSTFKVRLEGLESKIRALSINGKTMNASNLEPFFHSRTGRIQFQVDTKVVLTSTECSDPSGCICGNDEYRTLNHICNHVGNGRCPFLHCTDPVQPAGSCCPICGGLITLRLGRGFQFERLKSYIGTFLQMKNYRTVSCYVFKTYTGYIQAVFVDEEPHDSAALVKTLQQQFEDGDQKTRLGIVSSEPQYSEKWFHGPSPYSDSGNGLHAGGIVALVFGVLSVIIIAVLFYLQRHRLTPLAFSFGRFENEDDRYASHGALEMAVEMTQTIDPITGKHIASASIKAPDPSSSKGFDNPFYDPTCSDADFRDAAMLGKGYKSVDTRENPCYMAFERVEDLPPPASTEVVETLPSENLSKAETPPS